jgi:hypothetical protein
VEILARNPDEVAIKGIEAGTRVALVEPDAATQGQSKAPGAGSAVSGAPKGKQ